MAIYDKEGQLTYEDEAGNSYLLHPKTKMNCVDGLEEALGGKAPASHAESKNNPHGVSADQVGATPASHATNKSNPHGVTAAQVGARPSSWMPTAEQVGAAPMEYAKKVGNPHNLLDNSDFRNPVNQRGAVDGGFAANAFLLDRWQAVDGSISCIYRSDRISFSNMDLTANAGICQRLAFSDSDIGKTYTLAVMTADGLLTAYGQLKNVTAWTWICQNENESVKIRLGRYANTDNRFRIDILAKGTYSANILWAALYEGKYTAETLPEYQPKGYGAELLECERYYQRIGGLASHRYLANVLVSAAKNNAGGLIPMQRKMRIAQPTVTFVGEFTVSLYESSGISHADVSSISSSRIADHNIDFTANFSGSYVIGAHGYLYANTADSYIELSADL